MVAKGQITVGTLVASLSYMGGLFAPVQGLTGIYRTMRTAMVSIDQVFTILDTPDYIGDAPNAVCPQPVKGRVAFDHVDFAYDPKGQTVPQDIHFEAKPGEVVAIVVNADRILVLKKGRIIESGSHRELMAQNGYYASLVHRQTRDLLAA